MPVPNASAAPTVLKTTSGEWARRLAGDARLSNEWQRPPIFGPVAWQPDTYYEQGRAVAVGSFQWICIISGATSDASPPTWTSASSPTHLSESGSFANSTITILSGGAGSPAIGDKLTIGTGDSHTKRNGVVLVAAVSGTSITKVTPLVIPVFDTATPGTLTQQDSTGSGTGTTFSVGTGSVVGWTLLGSNYVTNDPGSSVYQVPWSQSLSVTAASTTASSITRETQYVANGQVFGVTNSGTTSGTGSGPSVGQGVITDGTASVVWLGPYRASPLPSGSYGVTTTYPSAPAGMLGAFAPDVFPSNFPAGAVNMFGGLPGSGYQIGDTVTISGGTETTNAVGQVVYLGVTASLALNATGNGYNANDIIYLAGGVFDIPAAVQVNTVSSGHILTFTVLSPGRYTGTTPNFTQGSTTGSGTAATFTIASNQWGISGPLVVTVQGAYTVLPNNTLGTVAIGATSGAGTGATLYIQWPDPFWCNLLHSYNGGGYTSGVCLQFVYQLAPDTLPSQNHTGFEFMTDTQTFYFQLQSSQGDPIGNFAILDPTTGTWFRLLADKLTIPLGFNGGNYSNYYTVTLPPGVKRVKWESIQKGQVPTIHVPGANSVWKPQTKAPMVPMVSDSIDAGSGWGPYLAGGSPCQRLSAIMGLNFWSETEGGTSLLAGGTFAANNNTFVQRLAEIALQSPSMLFTYGSLNDKSYSQVQVQAAAVTYLQTARTKLSNLPIIWGGVWPADVTGTITNAQIETSVQAGIATMGGTNGLIWFFPMTYASPPLVIGSYNNNPTPSGLSLPNSSNFVQVLGGDLTHPIDGFEDQHARFLSSNIQTILDAMN